VLRSSGSGAEASAPVRRGARPGERRSLVRGSAGRGLGGPLGPTRQGQRVHGASLPRVAGRLAGWPCPRFVSLGFVLPALMVTAPCLASLIALLPSHACNVVGLVSSAFNSVT
jgi:hypothetical protein